MYSRILVPVDLDNEDTLTKALDLAGQTAKRDAAEVIYVDVVDSVPTTSARTEVERLSDRLKGFALEQASRYGIRTTGEITLRRNLHLNVGSDIIKVASEVDCDLIIMASHVPGFKEHIFSSNAGYVASHAPMSVLVVR